MDVSLVSSQSHPTRPIDGSVAPGPAPGHSPLRPFLRVVAPELAAARRILDRALETPAARAAGALDLDRIRASALDAVGRTVLGWCARTFVLDLSLARRCGRLEGESSRARFEHHLEDLASPAGRRRLAVEFPLLLPDARRLAKHSAEALAEVVGRVLRDRGELEAKFGPLGRLGGLEPGLGDRHQNGRSVVILHFDHTPVVYKPRPLNGEVVFARLVEALRELEVGPPQRGAQVLHRGRYGYMEHVANRELSHPAEAALFYHRYGGLLALTHMVAATDLHFENLIAAGPWPVLVDLETLVQPSPGLRFPDGWARGPHAGTVLRTGLLPRGDFGPEAPDLSGLALVAGEVPARILLGADTDELRYSNTTVSYHRSLNLPRFHGETIRAWPHKQALLDGFEETYRGFLRIRPRLLGRGGVLVPLRRLRVRTVLRPTFAYARILDAMAHPDSLTSAQARERVLGKLHGARSAAVSPIQRGIERHALSRLDIPRLLCAATAVRLDSRSQGAATRDFHTSGWDEVRRRVSRLSLRELNRQRFLVDQAVESTRPPGAPSRPSVRSGDPCAPLLVPVEVNPAAFVRAAATIAGRIQSVSFRSGGEIHYLQLELRRGEHSQLYPLDTTLYGGLAGLALFFAELGEITSSQRHLQHARDLVSSVRRRLARRPTPLISIGAFAGLSGWVWVLLRLAKLWDRQDLRDEALLWLPEIAGRARSDEELDVIGGAAGALLVALEVERVLPGRGGIETARVCAERLAEKAQVDDPVGGPYVSWPTRAHPQHGLTGFGHGAAGIAAALARYGEVTGDSLSLRLAAGALAWERTSWDPELGSWRDLREDRRSAPAEGIFAWCHGAPGIGLARLLIPQSQRDHAWKLDLERCVEATWEHGLRGSHCLCHGQLGNLELLRCSLAEEQDPELSRARIASAAEAVLREVCDGPRGGSSGGSIPLGLLCGLGGIGYGLLRVAFPERVPSVLTLDLGTEIGR